MGTASQYEEMAQRCERYALGRRFKADVEAWTAVAKMWRALAATIDPSISADTVVDRAAESLPFGFGGPP
jgi:hypothetical protein